jgi:hypothetical protein
MSTAHVTRYARSGELQIAYQMFGVGPITIVEVTGFASHVELRWDFPGVTGPLARLARFARVVTFDNVGLDCLTATWACRRLRSGWTTCGRLWTTPGSTMLWCSGRARVDRWRSCSLRPIRGVRARLSCRIASQSSPARRTAWIGRSTEEWLRADAGDLTWALTVRSSRSAPVHSAGWRSRARGSVAARDLERERDDGRTRQQFIGDAARQSWWNRDRRATGLGDGFSGAVSGACRVPELRSVGRSPRREMGGRQPRGAA